MRRIVLGFALSFAACSTPPASPPDASSGDGASPKVAEDDGATAPDRATKPPSDDSGAEAGDDGDAPDPNQKFEVAVGNDACATDADCIKDACCHPKACVSVDKEPSCGDVACTLDCQAGTMDCFGGCLCQDGKCAARLWMGSVDG